MTAASGIGEITPKLQSEITFVVFSFNEEARIENVLRNFSGYGRILLVDNYSVDQTVEIAKRYNCDVLLNKNNGWVEDNVTTNRVKEHVSTDWIYWAFADEMIDRPTMDAIFLAVRSDRFDIVSVTRKNYYYGKFCHNLSADRMNRVFKKDSIDFTGNRIHQFGKPDASARICKLPSKYFVHHFISNTASSYLGVMDRYTDMECLHKSGSVSIPRLVAASLSQFIWNVLFRGGYKAGAAGCFLTCNLIYYRWLTAMKTLEKHSALDRSLIESRNTEVRENILRSFE